MHMDKSENLKSSRMTSVTEDGVKQDGGVMCHCTQKEADRQTSSLLSTVMLRNMQPIMVH
jgi:hypothetical protein